MVCEPGHWVLLPLPPKNDPPQAWTRLASTATAMQVRRATLSDWVLTRSTLTAENGTLSPMRSVRRLVALLGITLGAALGSPWTAYAQTASEAAATALFDEGRKLMGENRYAEACPKLAESQRLAPSGGTLLNLADCYEHTGQTASAWVAWKDAAARANAAGKADMEKLALSKAAALEPMLPRLTIAVDAGSNAAGLEVRRDGVVVGQPEFGLAIPVDAGSHLVEATAPRKKVFSARIDVQAQQTDARVTVRLEDEAVRVTPPVSPSPPLAVAPVPTPAPRPASGWGAQKTVAVVMGITGVGGLIVGSVFGLEAKSKNDQALEPQNCRTSTLCNQTGLDLTNDAKSAATVSTVSFVAGGVLVATGAVVWLTAPASQSPGSGVRIVPFLTASAGGLALDAGW